MEPREPSEAEFRFNCINLAISAEDKYSGLTENPDVVQRRIMDNAKEYYAYIIQSNATKRDEDNAAYFHDGWLAACKEVNLQMENNKPEDVEAWVVNQIDRNSPVNPEYTDRVVVSMKQAKAGNVQEHALDND